MADRSRGTYVKYETSPVNIQLSEEEKAVLKECRTNSLYFRGIPLGVIAAIATRQIVNQGYFPHVKRFSSIYYPAIFGLGLVVGIGSYRQKCFEKIMKLEHSTLADQVRDFYSKAGIPMDTPGGRSFNYQPHLPKEGGDNFSEDSIVQAGDSGLAPNKPQGAQNTMEFNREPFYQGSGEVIAMPNQLYEESKGQDTKQTTYEELRQRHRSRSQPTYQFESKQPSHGADQRSEKPHIMDDRKTLPVGRMPTHKEYRSSSHETQQAPVRRNKYGDVVE